MATQTNCDLDIYKALVSHFWILKDRSKLHLEHEEETPEFQSKQEFEEKQNADEHNNDKNDKNTGNDRNMQLQSTPKPFEAATAQSNDQPVLSTATNEEDNNQDTIQPPAHADGAEELEFDDGFGVVNAATLKAHYFDSIPMKATLTRHRSEEEVVGSMRYIYDIDNQGNRTLVSRKSLSKIAGPAHSLLK